MSPPRSTPWDVVVVGCGPAGASAALAASAAGASVLLLDREELPRRKTCGGGLIGASLAALPPGLAPPVRAQARAATFTLRGRWARTHRSREPMVAMVYRDELDAALVGAAREAGAQLRDGCALQGVEDGPVLRLTTSDGEVLARAVVGADGSAGRTSRYVGARFAEVDLGLEAEISVADPAWADRLLIDWGPLPGSYGWVFPKGDGLTVGVIARRGNGAGVRAYLADLLDRTGLAQLPATTSGHLTRCREPGSPLRRGGVLLAGDAAGLLEPFTREGISYALRSGRLAGTAAAALAAGRPERYEQQVAATFDADMAAGRALLRAYERRPAAFHVAVAALPGAALLFARVARGELSMARVLEHRSVRAALAVL